MQAKDSAPGNLVHQPIPRADVNLITIPSLVMSVFNQIQRHLGHLAAVRVKDIVGKKLVLKPILKAAVADQISVEVNLLIKRIATMTKVVTKMDQMVQVVQVQAQAAQAEMVVATNAVVEQVQMETAALTAAHSSTSLPTVLMHSSTSTVTTLNTITNTMSQPTSSTLTTLKELTTPSLASERLEPAVLHSTITASKLCLTATASGLGMLCQVSTQVKCYL